MAFNPSSIDGLTYRGSSWSFSSNESQFHDQGTYACSGGVGTTTCQKHDTSSFSGEFVIADTINNPFTPVTLAEHMAATSNPPDYLGIKLTRRAIGSAGNAGCSIGLYGSSQCGEGPSGVTGTWTFEGPDSSYWFDEPSVISGGYGWLYRDTPIYTVDPDNDAQHVLFTWAELEFESVLWNLLASYHALSVDAAISVRGWSLTDPPPDFSGAAWTSLT